MTKQNKTKQNGLKVQGLELAGELTNYAFTRDNSIRIIIT